MTSMRTLLLFAPLFAAVVQAAPTPGRVVMMTSQAQTTPDDDEDDEEPASPAAPGPGTTPPAASDAPKPAALAPTGAVPTPAETEAQRLVSGAPLFNPNVAVHIVEQKSYSDARKSELVLYPVAMQVNGKFTQHFGTMGSFVYHLQENFGLQISGGYNWYNTESSFNGELVEKFRVEAQAATSLLWTWGVMGGVEVSPLYGKFAIFEGVLAHFSFVLNGGVGAGGTRHQLRPSNVRSDGTVTDASYGDTGIRFMGSLGAGFRLQLGERFALRLEVRDVVYTARMERVNGCDEPDLKAMDDKLRGGQDPATATVSASCNLEKFTGVIEGTETKRSGDIPLARALVRIPSSDVLSNIGMYLGISFLF